MTIDGSRKGGFPYFIVSKVVEKGDPTSQGG